MTPQFYIHFCPDYPDNKTTLCGLEVTPSFGIIVTDPARIDNVTCDECRKRLNKEGETSVGSQD